MLCRGIFDKEILDSNTDMYHVCNSLEFRLKIKKCQSYCHKRKDLNRNNVPYFRVIIDETCVHFNVFNWN